MPKSKPQAPEILAQQKTTPLKELMELSYIYADEVLQNPVFQEKKAQQKAWKEVYDNARSTRATQAIQGAIEHAEANVLQLWACDCVEEGLYIYERQFQDSRLREALGVAQACVKGEVNEEALEDPINQAHDADLEATQKRDAFREEIFERKASEDPNLKYSYTDEVLLEQATWISHAVCYVVSPGALFARKAPRTEFITKGPLFVAQAIATVEFLDKQALHRVRSSLLYRARDERAAEIRENQALRLVAQFGEDQDLLGLLGQYSRYKRLELRELYLRSSQQRSSQFHLKLLRMGGPSFFRERIPEAIGTLDIDKASDPNTPPNELLDLAADYPKQVAQNPALSMIALEDPELAQDIYETIQQESIHLELERSLEELTPQQLMVWLQACAEHILEQREDAKEEQRPRRLLQTAVDCTNQTVTKSYLRTEIEAAEALYEEVHRRMAASIQNMEESFFLMIWRDTIRATIDAAHIALTADIEDAVECARDLAAVSKEANEECQWQLHKFREMHKASNHNLPKGGTHEQRTN